LFVGSGIFKSGDPEKRARAIVEATTHYMDANVLARVSAGLGEPMVGISSQSLEPNELLETRRWEPALSLIRPVVDEYLPVLRRLLPRERRLQGDHAGRGLVLHRRLEDDQAEADRVERRLHRSTASVRRPPRGPVAARPAHRARTFERRWGILRPAGRRA